MAPNIRPAAATDPLIAEIRQITGRNILVVRHSNEIRPIVNALSPRDAIGPVGEGEFNNLFVIHCGVYFWQRTTRLERLNYGAQKTSPRAKIF